MARTIDTIFNEMKQRGIALATEANNADAIAMFNNTSKVALWKLLFSALAFGVWIGEKLQDLFKLEVDDRISLLKPHSRRWYAQKAKDFQYGYNLVAETDHYDNTALTEQQVDDSMIIKHSAVTEQDRGIRIKVAKEVGGSLAAISNDELEAFTAYMEEVKDAGIKLLITSGPADDLKAKLRIFYDAQVLDANGARRDGSAATPVLDAFKDYLKNLPFNGLFVPQLMIDHLQAVDGVIIVKDDSWQSRYGVLDYSGIDVEYLPDAGYLRLPTDADLQLTFIPHERI